MKPKLALALCDQDTVDKLREYADDLGISIHQAGEEIIYWYLFKAGDQIFELEKLNRKQGA